MTTFASLLAAAGAFTAVVVLPGFGVLTILRVARRRAPLEDEARGTASTRGDGSSLLVLAVAWSTIAIAAIGSALLAFGAFSTARIAIPALVLSLLGLPCFAIWLRGLWPSRWTAVFLLALASPWAASVLASGFASAQSFQWYYWLLGRDLDAAGGIPAWVTEYGERVRWPADYVFFNVTAEAYRGLFPGSDAAGMVAWRFPAALLALALVYLVLRLWLSRLGAIVGTAAVSATTLFLLRVDSFKPEAAGVILGLAGVWLTVQGVREGRFGLLLLAGGVFGIDAGVHPIATTALGLMAIAGGCVELPAVSRARASVIQGLAIAGVTAAAVVVATGWVLQGRLVLATDVANPRFIEGRDLTWEVLRASEGAPMDDAAPGVWAPLSDTVSELWPGVGFGSRAWLLLPLLAGIVLASRFADARARRGLAALAVTGALLALAVAFFALAFDTYVPRYTGVGRLALYFALIAGLAVGFGADALHSLWRRSNRGRLPALAWLSLGVFMLAWAVPTAGAVLTSGPRISQAGTHALEFLRDERPHASAVLVNASTHGSVRFLTGVAVPLEGRQPVLEKPDFLQLANRRLEGASEFFDRPARHRPLLQDLNVSWVVAANHPNTLGAVAPFGDPSGVIQRLRRVTFLEEVWSEDGIAIFRTRTAGQLSPSVGPAQPLAGRWIAVTAGLFVLLLVVGGVGRKLSRADGDDYDASAPTASAVQLHSAGSRGRRSPPSSPANGSRSRADG